MQSRSPVRVTVNPSFLNATHTASSPKAGAWKTINDLSEAFALSSRWASQTAAPCSCWKMPRHRASPSFCQFGSLEIQELRTMHRKAFRIVGRAVQDRQRDLRLAWREVPDRHEERIGLAARKREEAVVKQDGAHCPVGLRRRPF